LLASRLLICRISSQETVLDYIRGRLLAGLRRPSRRRIFRVGVLWIELQSSPKGVRLKKKGF